MGRLGTVGTTYDRIGIGYSDIRRPDPRLGALIAEALGEVRSVVNVGAGAGSYEPPGAEVVAVEPSLVMVAQHRGTRRVRAVAEALPFAEGTFDAAMAVMTIHHWRDVQVGLAEMRRVSRRQVVFTWDKDHAEELWIVSEYLPEIRTLEQARFPSVAVIADVLESTKVLAFPIPHDFDDGYQPAFWRRPEAYLDPAIRAASSTFAALPAGVVDRAMGRLAADLRSGRWAREHEDLLRQDAVDYGYRLIVSG